ncbi:MAG: hypothetical protein JWM27_655 [Gemmatimonadetes bacterium]|nr:hypothetical protein [Gemmatimonadota bacterium]
MSTITAHASPEAAAVPPQPSSLPARLVKLFVAPGELFEEFRESAPWGGALAVTLAISVLAQLAIYFLVSTATFSDLIRAQLLHQTGQVPPDDLVAKVVPQARVIGLVASVFGPIVVSLLGGAVVLVVSRLIMGGKGAFGQYLAVVTHVLVLLTLGGVLVAPLIFMKRDPGINLSLTLLFPSMPAKGLVYGLMHSLDVFTVWGLALVGLGAAKVDGRRSWVPTAAAVAVVYLFVVVGIPFLLSLVMPHPAAA